MSETPFPFGSIATKKAFIGREKETARLHQNFSSCTNTCITSPPGHGKSSLLREAVRLFCLSHKKRIPVFLEMGKFYSDQAFYTAFANAIIHAVSESLDEYLDAVKVFLRGAKVNISTISGEATLELDSIYIKEHFMQILMLPQAIAENRSRKFIICIENLEQLPESFIAAWQGQYLVSYVFASSAGLKHSPEFADTVTIDRIKSGKLAEFLERTFHESGKKISDELCREMVSRVEKHPGYLQQLARNTWMRSGAKTGSEELEAAWGALLDENQRFYQALMNGLTAYQASFLRAVLSEEAQLYSARVIQTYDLGSSANVRKMYTSLSKRGILYKEKGRIRFTDPVIKTLFRKNHFCPAS